MLTAVLAAIFAAPYPGLVSLPRCEAEPLAAVASPPTWLAWHWRPASMRVVARDAPPSPEEVVEAARAYLGSPYEWGGIGEGGFDCSGFTNKVYADSGYDLPRTAEEQFLVGKPVSYAELRPGDLVFFSPEPGASRISHVGVYAGNGELIHASSGKGEVTYDRLGARYYSSRLVGARRVLALAPGAYSNPDGSARPGGGAEPSLDDLVRAALADQDVRGGVLALTEHAQRPRQLASYRPAVQARRSGPATLAPQSTAVGVRLGAGRLGDSAGLIAVPEIGYFGHGDALVVRLAAPFELPFAGEPRDGASWRDSWDEPRELARVVQEVRYGQKGSDLFVELGRTASGTLGHGSLVRQHTPSLASRTLPDYELWPEALSLDAAASVGAGGAEVFIDDVLAPNVAGTRLSLRPGVLAGSSSDLARSVALGLTYAVDAQAPHLPRIEGGYTRRAVHGLALDGSIDLVSGRRLVLTSYAAAAGLAHRGGAGAGGTVGTLLRASLAGRRLHSFRLRLEGTLASPAFIPAYFDATYGMDRWHAPVASAEAEPVSKLRLLEDLEGTAPRWGAYIEVGYEMQRRIHLGATYEDGGPLGSLPASQRYAGRNLFVYAELRDLYLPASSKSVSLYLTYHRRNFRRLTPVLADSDADEYLFAAASLRLSQYVWLGGGLRRALDVASGSAQAVDAVIDLTVRYEP